jgi:hypothetical protein
MVVGIAATVASVNAQPVKRAPERAPIQWDLQVEPLTAFESRLLGEIRRTGRVFEGQAFGTAAGNARGLALRDEDAGVIGVSVAGRKYGVSLDGTGRVLIKNFRFMGRRSNDRFGSGIILGQKTATHGETWLSNAWIDLKERGPDPDYQRANNEAISVEHGNRPLNVRRTVMLGGQDAGLDTKGDVRIDASFIASGHRPVRIWSGDRVVITNSVVLAFKGFGGFWFGGEKGVASLEYYNCRFGQVGDRADQLEAELPAWMIERDPADPISVQITRLKADPFDRGEGSFWTPAEAPRPGGYLK